MWQVNKGDIPVFSGSDREEGNVDGLPRNCRFKQPIDTKLLGFNK